jgi:hypothetical protein
MIENDSFDSGWSVTLRSSVHSHDDVETRFFVLGHDVRAPSLASIDAEAEGGDEHLGTMAPVEEMAVFLATALGKYLRLVPRLTALKVVAKIARLAMVGRGEKVKKN